MRLFFDRNSLVHQLIFRLLLVAGLALLVSVAMLWWQFGRASDVALDRGLGAKLDTIIGNFGIDGNGLPVVTLPPELEATFGGGLFFTVSNEHGQAFLSVPEGRIHAYHHFEPAESREPQFFEHYDLQSGVSFLGVTRRVAVGERAFWVQLVEEIPRWKNFLNYSIAIFLHGAGVLIVLHFIGSVFLAQATIRASLEPVAQAAGKARDIVPGYSTTRISDAALPSEVRPLAEAVDLALDRLDNALSAQRRFTADAAHELLTPVAVMKARIETLEDRALAVSLARDVDEMATIVEQLLELSELEAEGAGETGQVDLHEVAVDVVAKLAPLAIRRGIDPGVTGEDGPVMVRGCAKTLARALTNLVQNAILHASGATRIEVRLGPGSRLAVIDDGQGIPPAERAAIFERFHRVQGAPARGTGLGLAIVRRIVAAHGGRIAVTDAPCGRGAAFVIDLPA